MSESISVAAFALAVSDADFAVLAEAVGGRAVRPGEPGFAEVLPFNVAHSPTPLVAVLAESAEDVAATVDWARQRRLPVAVQATGHGAMESLAGGVLVCTRRMTDVTVSDSGDSVRVAAGATWADVLDVLPAGRTGLCGSTSHVGVVGYLTGGGLPLLGRTFGMAGDAVTAVEVVTADGILRRVEPDADPELFWALRGAKGGLGVVTAVETGLVPLDTVFAGSIMFPGEHAAEVLHAWQRWVADVPEAMNSSVALMRLPDLPMVPEPMRGQFVVSLRIAFVGPADEGTALVAALRAAAPAIADEVGEVPATQLDAVHHDPTEPMPVWQRGGLLRELTTETVDALLEVAGSGADTPLLLVELRHLGGALARGSRNPSAAPGRDAAFSVITVGVLAPPVATLMPTAGDAVFDALAPWTTGGSLLNFLGELDAPEALVPWPADTAARLLAVKQRVDPADLFRFGPRISPVVVPAQGRPGA